MKSTKQRIPRCVRDSLISRSDAKRTVRCGLENLAGFKRYSGILVIARIDDDTRRRSEKVPYETVDDITRPASAILQRYTHRLGITHERVYAMLRACKRTSMCSPLERSSNRAREDRVRGYVRSLSLSLSRVTPRQGVRVHLSNPLLDNRFNQWRGTSWTTPWRFRRSLERLNQRVWTSSVW